MSHGACDDSRTRLGTFTQPPIEHNDVPRRAELSMLAIEKDNVVMLVDGAESISSDSKNKIVIAAQDIMKGSSVKVISSFKSDDLGHVDLKIGMRGHVTRIEED